MSLAPDRSALQAADYQRLTLDKATGGKRTAYLSPTQMPNPRT